MSYVIIGDLFSYPEGEASTNRVHTFAKGLTENGYNVHVICFRNDYLPINRGEVNGVKFYRPLEEKERNRHFLIRNWKKMMKFFRTVSIIRKLNREEKISAIIAYTSIPATFLFTWLLKVITRSVLILEISEHPMRNYEDGKLRLMLGKLKLKMEIRLVDGIFCISHFLINFYTERGMPLHRLLLLPSTVDPGRFSINSGRPLPYPYVGYFGMLSFSRDNLNILIEAFSSIMDKHPGLRLVLGGPQYHNEVAKIEELVSQLGIGQRFLLLDYLPREEVIRYMVNSELLVMVRANDEKTQASFPSKLTEYLASGKPVISVNVGEISQYLKDGENVFLVEPGNMEKLAEKMELVLSGYKKALETANKGRKLTQTVFNYKYQAKRIIPFVDSLYKL